MFDKLFEKNTFERAWVPVVLLVFLFIYLTFILIFWEKNFWWILPMFVYVLYFLHNDQILKYKTYNDRIRLKDIKEEKRIDFY